MVGDWEQAFNVKTVNNKVPAVFKGKSNLDIAKPLGNFIQGLRPELNNKVPVSLSNGWPLSYSQQFVPGYNIGMVILNIAAYKFVSIPDPLSWQPLLKSRCHQLSLKGTILLATEGLNLFLAGSQESIKSFLQYLSSDDLFGGRFSDLETKESVSPSQPFGRMVVRVASEIITMRHPTIVPEGNRAPDVDPARLKLWLDRGHDDNGRPVVMMDTRNKFEVEIGTFAGALSFDIEKFSQFPQAITQALSEQVDLKDKTIVSFCTGGIRCEKAALYMHEIDMPYVYQLHGGILGYFEHVGGDHWNGECFVFDERVALDSALQPTIHSYPGRPVKD